MFENLIESLVKAAVGVVTLPIAVAADVITMGGVFSANAAPYTYENVAGIVTNLTEATKP